jgi:hypothetical protein
VLLRVLGEVYDLTERLGVNPVVAGGLAVSYWGHPRSTQDIDLAVIVPDEPYFFSKLIESNLVPSKSGRLIDLADIQTLYAMQGSSLDHGYLDEKVHELHLKPRFWLYA